MTENMHGILFCALFLLLASLAHAMKKHRRRIEAIEGRIALEAQLKAGMVERGMTEQEARVKFDSSKGW